MTPSAICSSEIYLLPLNDDGSPDIAGQYVYLAPRSPEPFVVRFSLEGTSSVCRYGSLWVNIPENGEDFKREKFREFKLVPNFSRNIEIDITIPHAGAYAYYITYAGLPPLAEVLELNDTSEPEVATHKTDLFYIDVAPYLTINSSPLPLDGLSVFTVLSKFMGKYPKDWSSHFHGISERGYNMLHFTPLQVRGSSNSPYSLFDQLAWDSQFFPNGESDIAKLVDDLEKNYGLLSLTDVVLNHTAHNSKWLEEHPEAGYNLTTAPWMESAYILDTKLLQLSSKLTEKALPTVLNDEKDLLKIMDAIKTDVIFDMRLWEFYTLDIEANATAAVAAWKSEKYSFPEEKDIEIIEKPLKEQAKYLTDNGLSGNDRMGSRFRRHIDPEISGGLLALHFGRFESDSTNGADEGAAKTKISTILDAVNLPFYKEYDAEVADILQQLFSRIKYMRLEENGPKLGEITAENPLIETYFTRLPKNEKTAQHSEDDLALANNGWVWGGNALIDNAGPNSRAYLRREVIVWGDCVKLRYGSSPEDSPYLWDRMTKYVRLLTKYFAGLRIDNCHSTPIHVAEHILDEARRIRPNVYVVAELFSGSEETDYVFVKRLGLSSLIREAMQAWSTGELSRLVHRHGGRPIGSFERDEITRTDAKTADGAKSIESTSEHTRNNLTTKSRELIRNIKSVPVQALFMDCTHDNETPFQKRDARDTLPNAALVSMCASASGSVMGYDEIYPKIIDLVGETRLYVSEASSSPSVKIGAGKNGIAGVKKLLNQIHTIMGKDGYDETHVHHEDQYVTVHRVHPKSRKGYFLIAHTAFPGYGNGNGAFNPVHLTGTKAKHIGSWMLEVDTSEEALAQVLNDKTYLNGLPSQVVDLSSVKLEGVGNDTFITVHDKFPPGSIALFETWIPSVEHSAGLDTYVTSEAAGAFNGLDLVDLNFVLYRCEAEERSTSNDQDGNYDIPGYGKITYAGLQGWWSLIEGIVRDNNLSHPLCQNLRDGLWALDSTIGRLERRSKTPGCERLAKPAKWLKERFDALHDIPSFLIPRYFALVIGTAYRASWDRAMSLMSPGVHEGQWFIQSLAMVSVQQTGIVPSASLYPKTQVPSLAAGLPHFAVEWARCWGRDVMISLRGLYLGTGRFDEAKEHIKAFGSVMKHGMIPNLLGSGGNPRYNARDSIWFFLQCIQEYTKIVPDGISILDEKVKRRFLPYDDTWFAVDDSRAYSNESTIAEIIQEALQRHAAGISFREANAGAAIDSQMSDEGFNIDIKVDWENGFIFGGNQHNCGTWMDKMGESVKARSKGVPGTPRDGAAVEITGMLYSTLKWVSELNAAGKFAKPGVEKADGSEISFADWAALVKTNFERCYFVPKDSVDDSKYDVNPSMINRRGIYKDLYRSGKEYEDYQLRPNFPIAMCVAPDLFEPAHALSALFVAESVLRGPTGMATLDPTDINYRPYYINSEDSTDFATAKGRNYHQGPEWLWPTGFFLRALLKFDLMRRGGGATARTESFQQITKRLIGCKKMIRESPWAGLAELTQKNGEFCGDSCPTQAWSASCLIDLYMDAAMEHHSHDLSIPIHRK
ncbi:bifunctional 4-alpha-glucanotransferase/amylo-alpha-1,6-glucosidase [Ceratocystis pirilliformis]|uniref:Glycogen debranching enzyme n=1 Tax=Ceratocystis pirilliformis TaxID=259994 RepID=A0ABR3ZAY5_9PEZI